MPENTEENQPTPPVNDLLTTNRTTAAVLRDFERAIADGRLPLLDLRTVPPAEWPALLGRDLLPPPEIRRYLDGREPGPMSREEVQGLELAVERWHGIAPPYHAGASMQLQADGCPWRYEPACAPYVSGFTLGREEA